MDDMFDKFLKYQEKVNKKYTSIALMFLAYVYMSEKRYKKDKEKINRLIRDVEELNVMKGE